MILLVILYCSRYLKQKYSITLAFLADLGIEDPECYSEPEISELSDEDPPLPSTKPPGVTEPDPENADSEWDSTQPSTTPRPGILKNWKQVRKWVREVGQTVKLISYSDFLVLWYSFCELIMVAQFLNAHKFIFPTDDENQFILSQKCKKLIPIMILLQN